MVSMTNADFSFQLFKPIKHCCMQKNIFPTMHYVYSPANPPPLQRHSEEPGGAAFISQQSDKRGNIIHHTIHSQTDFITGAEQRA